MNRAAGAQTHSAGRSPAVRNQDIGPRTGRACPAQRGHLLNELRGKGPCKHYYTRHSLLLFFFFLRQKTLVWGVKVKELEGEAKVGMEARAGFCDGCVLSDGAAVKVQNTLARFF